MRKLLAPVLLGTVLLASLTACSTSGAAEDVASQIELKLGSQIGGVQAVSCPDDLPGEVGASITCTMITKDYGSRDVNVTVTSVDGGQVNFDMEAPPVG
jgi:hypothetical protein